jgi:hypothetical protein
VTQYHVTLNAQGYILDLDRYRKRVREPFAPKQATASASYSLGDLKGPEQLFVISDWSGGEGYAQHDETHPERWRQGSGLDGFSIAGGLELGPRVESPAFGGGLTSLRPLAVYKGKLFLGGANGSLYSWDGATFAFVAAMPAGIPTCAAVFSEKLFIGNSVDGKLSSWDGAVFTNAVATAGGPIHTLCTHYRQAAQYLYVGAHGAGAGGIGRAYYWDGAALSLGQFDFEEIRPYASVVLGSRLYFVAGDATNRRWGLYSVDNSGSGGSWACHVRTDTGYGVSIAALNGVLYVGDGVSGRIWAWDGSRLSVVRQLSSGGTAYTGELLGLAAWRGALWVSILGTTGLDLLRYDPSASSEPALSAAKGQAAWSRPVRAVGAANSTVERIVAYGDRLCVGTGSAGGFGDVYPVNPLTFGASGTLDSGLISCGLPGVSKLFRSVTVVTSAIVSSQTVKVEYQLEDTGAWTTLGTLAAVGATTATYAFAANTTGRQIAFRITLTGTAGASTSPILYELALRYTPRPTVTREWELAVRLEGTGELPMVTLDGAVDPSTGAALTLALWTAAASAAPVSYVDLDGLAYSVYVQDVREQIADISQRTGLQRLGLVTLVEAA